MEKRFITYKDKKIEVKEPTIKVWKLIYSTKDITDEYEMSLNLISASTGLTLEELKEVEYGDVLDTSQFLIEYYNTLNTKFSETFTFKDKKYRFLDLPTISFGNYVDIDTYLSKNELDKIQGLNKYMSMLYVGEGDDPNDLKLRKEREEIFNELPIKYYLGAHSFFLSLSQTSVSGMRDYLIVGILMILRKLKRNKALIRFGVGTQRLVNWLKTILLKLKKLLTNH